MTTLAAADPATLTTASRTESAARSRALLRAFTADAFLALSERRAELVVREEGAIEIVFPSLYPLQVSLGSCPSGYYVETRWTGKPVTTLLCADIRTALAFLEQSAL